MMRHLTRLFIGLLAKVGLKHLLTLNVIVL